MSEEPNDVRKALAAFGAPSIRYGGFGQGQARASRTALPRRAEPANPAPAPSEPQHALGQHHPAPAAEPLPYLAQWATPLQPAEPPGAPALPEAAPASEPAASIAAPDVMVADYAAEAEQSEPEMAAEPLPATVLDAPAAAAAATPGRTLAALFAFLAEAATPPG